MGRDIAASESENKCGASFYSALSNDLRAVFPGVHGLSIKNLHYIKRFYLLVDDVRKLPQPAGTSDEMRGQSIFPTGLWEKLKSPFPPFHGDISASSLTDRYKKFLGTSRIMGVSQKQKLQDFFAAIDKVIPGSFREQLTQEKGVENFRTDKKTLWDGSQYVDGKILLYGEEELYTACTEEELKMLDRMAYLAICNIEDLIPDATPYPLKKCNEQWHFTFDLQTPPSWFTPLTKMPRLL